MVTWIRRQKHKSKKAGVHARLHTKLTTLNVIGHLNYSFECDWLIELSDNKLSDNNLASE